MQSPSHVPDDEGNAGAPSNGTPVAEELRRQEALLRGGAPAARVTVVAERALSFGIGVDRRAPYLRRAEKEGIPTVRRSTGGSGVLHLEGDVLWAIVLPRSDARVGRDFARAYGRLGSGVAAGLAPFGVRASWVPAPRLVSDYCLLSSRGQVLEAEGKLLGGAAQHVTANALLHQGCLSWEVDRPTIDRCFGLPRHGPSARLGGIAELAAVGGPGVLARALERALADYLGGSRREA